MIEIRSSTSAAGGSIGNGYGYGHEDRSSSAFGCAVTSAGGRVPYHLSLITYHVSEAGTGTETGTRARI
jgi:hypothetical protein